MSDPRQCERCGETMVNGNDCEPVGNFLFLCERCTDILRNTVPLPIVPARFLGVQGGLKGFPPVCLYNMLERVEQNGYVLAKGTTVTRYTLHQAGMDAPAAEVLKAQAALNEYETKLQNKALQEYSEEEDDWAHQSVRDASQENY